MPDMDGYEFLNELRALGVEHGGQVPAIALTAFASGSDIVRIHQAGFQLNLSKLVEPAELILAIAALVHGQTFSSSEVRSPRPNIQPKRINSTRLSYLESGSKLGKILSGRSSEMLASARTHRRVTRSGVLIGNFRSRSHPCPSGVQHFSFI